MSQAHVGSPPLIKYPQKAQSASSRKSSTDKLAGRPSKVSVARAHFIESPPKTTEDPHSTQSPLRKKLSAAKLDGRLSKVSIAVVDNTKLSHDEPNDTLRGSRISLALKGSRASMAPRVSRASMAPRGSRASAAPRGSRASMAPRPSTACHDDGLLRTSFALARTSKVRPSTDFESLVTKMGADRSSRSLEGESEFKMLTDYFMGFWKPRHAAAALRRLEILETKRAVRKLQKIHGFWQPPPEVTEALKNKNQIATPSNLPDTTDGRNLKFVLKILGCPLRENQQYKRFLKAKTLRQKRHWLYKYQGPHYNENASYSEPICPLRLKRLYHFFPDRFTEEEGFMYFNNKLLAYDEGKNVFYVGYHNIMNEAFLM